MDYTKNENLIFLHPPDKVARKASDVSAADWRYKSMQLIRQMFFLSSFREKSVTIFSIFHIPLLSWQLHKVAKNNNGELISSSRQFCTWDIYSQKWKKKHLVKYDDAIYLIPIRLLLEQLNVFLPYKKRMLICKIDFFTLSWVPKKIKRTPIFLIHSLSASHMKREFCVFSVLDD